MRVDRNFFPGFVRKSITFTIDDGNLIFDKKFIDIVKPYGFCGTFNLSQPNLEEYSSEFYREFYDGFGISNHCKYHPLPILDEQRALITDEAFSEDTADITKIYKTDEDGIYLISHQGRYWGKCAEPEAYARLAEECKRELEEVFGAGSITTFVWPYHESKNPIVKDYMINKAGYRAVRRTGELRDTTGFSLPTDRGRWTYNTWHLTLLEVAELYEKYPDDGELKFFCFGLHAVDYENSGRWDDLCEFAKKYGNRKDAYYYASVEDIFAYEDAKNSLKEAADTLENPSDITLYVKVDGKPIIIPPKTKIAI